VHGEVAAIGSERDPWKIELSVDLGAGDVRAVRAGDDVEPAVRLVDRLSEAGYVRRTEGADARTTSIVLTKAGRRVAANVAAARADLLSTALADLSDDERRIFAGVTGHVLAGLVRGPAATRWICRLCDTATCGRAEGRCPSANAAAATDVPRDS
jgi:hypothetical protein